MGGHISGAKRRKNFLTVPPQNCTVPPKVKGHKGYKKEMKAAVYRLLSTGHGAFKFAKIIKHLHLSLCKG
jgi:hypothetical protein